MATISGRNAAASSTAAEMIGALGLEYLGPAVVVKVSLRRTV
jgi:hypothetical protein